MAQGKKTFVMHTNLIDVVMGGNKHNVEIPEMSDEDAGQLLKWILCYVNDLHPTPPRHLIYIIAQIKSQLDSELEAYKKQCEVNRENGKLGGRPKKQDEPKETEKTQVVFEKPKKADNDNDNEYDNDKDSNNTISGNPTLNARCINDNFNSFWKEYPKKIGKDKCLKWFKIHKPDDALVCKMVQTIKTFKESTQWEDKQYIPYPYTWLNRGGWDDEVELSKYNTGNYSIANQWEEL